MYQNPYMSYGNQYYPNYQNYQMPVQQVPMQQNQNTQPTIANTTKMSQLQGKVVDNIDVVKATEIPLDGSISFFPLADGSGIITKQYNTDGTSKITVYKPIEEKPAEVKNYVTLEELEDKLKKFDLRELQNDLEDLTDNFEKFKKEMKKKVD